MNKPELYQKTVDILVDAYFKDTLMHNMCTACAVGNIVAANCGYRVDIINDQPVWLDEHGNPVAAHWGDVFQTKTKTKFLGYRIKTQTVKLEKLHGEALKEIKSTGYTPGELARIEFAFENVQRGFNRDLNMFKGLMAVINELDKIHGNTDKAATKQTKRKFRKPALV